MLDALKQAVELIKQWHGPSAWDIYYNNAPEMKPIREAIEYMEKDNEIVPPALVEAMKNTASIMFQAIEADEHPERQIAYRKMAAVGSPDSTSSFQVIVEVCINEEHYLEDGVIAIITDRQYENKAHLIISPYS